MSDPFIDLTQHPDRLPPKQKGDLTLYFSWSLHNGRPLMVLLPTHRREDSEHLIPCIVPMDTAFQWDEHTGDAAHCARMAFQFANALGMNPYEPRNLIRITSAVREHLGDLLMMPAKTNADMEVVADAIVTDTSTGRTRETEVVDYV